MPESLRAMWKNDHAQTIVPLSRNFKERDRVARELIERGFASIPSSLPTLTDQIFEGMERLASDRGNELWKIPDEMEIYSDRLDLGFFQRTKGQLRQNPRPDEVAVNAPMYEKDKFVLHYNDRLLAYLARNKTPIDSYAAMLKRLSYMHRAAAHLSILVAEDLDRLMPGYDFTRRLLEEGEHNKSKLFMYPLKDKPRRVRVHRDQSLLTIQVAGTHPGLVLWDEKGEKASVSETDPSSVLIFFGIKMFPITKGRYKGIAHGVDFRESIASGAAYRHSLVCFIQGSLAQEERAWMRDHYEELLDETLERL